MTRKDHSCIARVFSFKKPKEEQFYISVKGTTGRAVVDVEAFSCALSTWGSIAFRMADELGRKNPNFKRSLFIKACEL